MSTEAVPQSVPETSQYLLDRSVSTLRSRARDWAGRSMEDRLADLGLITERTLQAAPDLVADAVRAKGIPDSMAGEEWVAGPLTVLRTIRFLADTIRGVMRAGEVPLGDSAISERPDGQVVIDVVPADRWDRILYPRWSAKVRMDPVIRRAQARQFLGGIYTKPETFDPGVALVLGAGNVSSIAPLDAIQKMFVEGQTVLVKFNPVNEYIGPYIEHAFSHLMSAGFMRTAYGGAAVGDYLVMHPEVDSIHVTGSEATHNAIVFGVGADGDARRARNEPRFSKPITSELGNVSPVIIAPGRWSRRAMEFQAEHVATQLVQNAGYNCNAAKVMIVPAAWEQRAEFEELVGAKLASRPERPAYYPGSEDRYRRVVDAGGEVRVFGSSSVPPTIISVDASAEHPAFSEESFCRLMASVEIGGEGVAAYLDRAVEFANSRLRGTLNATVIIDKETLSEHGEAVERAVDRLEYGSIGVNLWAAACFPLGVTPWGAFPGHTLDDIGSGIGFVHNARLVDRPQKTVVRAPFVQLPKPAWSVFHRNAATTLRRATAFEANPAVRRVPGLLSAALRA